jgi:hypothetical protein
VKSGRCLINFSNEVAAFFFMLWLIRARKEWFVYRHRAVIDALSEPRGISIQGRCFFLTVAHSLAIKPTDVPKTLICTISGLLENGPLWNHRLGYFTHLVTPVGSLTVPILAVPLFIIMQPSPRFTHLFYSQDENIPIFRNFGVDIPGYTAPHFRR